MKAKITDEIAMPASKQKLQIGVSCGCTLEELQPTELCEGPSSVWETHCMYSNTVCSDCELLLLYPRVLGWCKSLGVLYVGF